MAEPSRTSRPIGRSRCASGLDALTSRLIEPRSSGTPTPDRVSFLQIVTTQASSGKALKMFGTSFNFAARQTDYSGSWNGFVLSWR